MKMQLCVVVGGAMFLVASASGSLRASSWGSVSAEKIRELQLGNCHWSLIEHSGKFESDCHGDDVKRTQMAGNVDSDDCKVLYGNDDDCQVVTYEQDDKQCLCKSACTDPQHFPNRVSFMKYCGNAPEPLPISLAAQPPVTSAPAAKEATEAAFVKSTPKTFGVVATEAAVVNSTPKRSEVVQSWQIVALLVGLAAAAGIAGLFLRAKKEAPKSKAEVAPLIAPAAPTTQEMEVLNFQIGSVSYTAKISNRRPASADPLRGFTHELTYLKGRVGVEWVALDEVGKTFLSDQWGDHHVTFAFGKMTVPTEDDSLRRSCC